MASQYQRPASITPPGIPEHLFWLLVTLAGLLALPSSLASADQNQALKPYTAEYKTTARGFDLNVTRKLEAGDRDHYILTNGGKILVVGFHEISVFRIEDNSIVPVSYVYQGTGMVNRRRELHFAPDQNSINSLYKGELYQLPYTETTLDRMNQMEQLRLVLMEDPDAARDIILRVADGKRVKDSHLVLIGEETLQTPLGPVETLHYERLHDNANRKSDLWFAPNWDYLMVRTVHIEDGDAVELMLTSAVIGDKSIGRQ